MSATKVISITRTAIIAAVGLISAACSSLPGNQAADARASGKQVRQVVQSPEESEAQYTLGKYYIGQGRIGLALAAFNRAIAHDATNVEARNARGIALVRIGDVKGAVQSLETAVASSPETPHLLNNLAYTYMLSGSLILAADTLREALRIDPKNKVALENLKELASRATKNNPELAKHLTDSVLKSDQQVLTPEPVVPEVKPRSDAGRVPSSISVVNIGFGGVVTQAEPLVASVQQTPAAVDVQAASRLNLIAVNTLNSSRPTTPTFVGASVAGAAISEPITEHPSKTTFVTSLIPSETLALRSEMIAKKTSSLPRFAKANLPEKYALRKPRVAVANGNGVSNVAKTLSASLRRNKLKIWRITNAASFDNPVTRIYYTKRFKNEALVIGQMLPVQAELVEKPEELRYSDIKIVIGADLGTREMANEVLSVPVRGSAV